MPSFIILSLATLYLTTSVLGCNDSVPAIYTFGDSLADVGNNNFLSNPILKADFPHNGVDFPTGKPTGRFSNGKNTVDILSEKVGLPSAPPYLSLVSTDTAAMVTGVNFASGSAGILNGTNKPFGPIPLTQQVEYYTLVHNQLVQELGSTHAKIHLAKSLFVIVIGSNDILFFFRDSQVSKHYSPKQYVNLAVSTLEQLMKRLYELGARKFVVNGVGLIGCCPAQMARMNTTDGCKAAENHWSKQYNRRLLMLLEKLKMQSPDMNYSYFDTYLATAHLIRNPQHYGISETREACCGIGKFNAEGPCLPNSTYCSNRSGYLFWDLYHPTEMVSRILADLMYNGSRQFTYPMNVGDIVRL